MSVYIRGMETPKACIFCELYDHENYWCNAAKKEVELCFDENSCSFCPLIPVPDHGDLIDRDELSKLLEKYWSEFSLNASESKDYNLLYEGFGIRDAELVAYGLPIIIPADKDGEK